MTTAKQAAQLTSFGKVNGHLFEPHPDEPRTTEYLINSAAIKGSDNLTLEALSREELMILVCAGYRVTGVADCFLIEWVY